MTEDLYKNLLNLKNPLIQDRLMRAIWRGWLSFGLINIPVNLYSGTREKELKFHFIHEKDLSPIHYARICNKEGKEVPWEEVVKGYEFESGDRVILTDEDFEKVNIARTKTIDILDFTSATEIDPIYFERPFFLEPQKGAAKAYELLKVALETTKKVGIAKFVLKNREHLGLIRPYKGIILLQQLRFASEIRSLEPLHAPKEERISRKEVEMAIKLIDQLTEHFKPSQYKDTYQEEVMSLIKKKKKGRIRSKKTKMPRGTKKHDLLKVLKSSLKKKHRKLKKAA